MMPCERFSSKNEHFLNFQIRLYLNFCWKRNRLWSPNFEISFYFGVISSSKFIFWPKIDIFLKMLPCEQHNSKNRHFLNFQIRLSWYFRCLKNSLWSPNFDKCFYFGLISSSKFIFRTKMDIFLELCLVSDLAQKLALF